jgi:hypothetical protein
MIILSRCSALSSQETSVYFCFASFTLFIGALLLIEWSGYHPIVLKGALLSSRNGLSAGQATNFGRCPGISIAPTPTEDNDSLSQNALDIERLFVYNVIKSQ